jgi:hypothetical protein
MRTVQQPFRGLSSWWTPSRVKFCSATRAKENRRVGHHAIFWLKDGFDTIFKAICAKEMRRFASASLFFQHIAQDISPLTQLGEFVFLLLGVPCSKVSHFFFKLTYAANQRRMRRLNRYYSIWGRDDLVLEFEPFLPSDSSIVSIYNELRKIYDSTQRCEHRAKISHVNHS